jgi:2-methylcitrate dehydratase
MTKSATQTGPLETSLADFALALSFDDLPESAVTAAKMRVLDSIGVAMAAYLSPPAKIARRLAPEVTDDADCARIWGDGRQTTLEDAAFANGVMVRYLDLNDAWRTRDAHHPSDYLPGVLGVAEALDSSGRDFIAALAIAYEVMCRFTDAVPFNTAGWDQPVSGAIATALAAGRLMGLDHEALCNAISLAVVPNLCTYQTRAGELSMWKGCAGPNGARNGIFAARLAREGMTGPYQAFDGIFGIWNQTLGGKAYALALPDGKDDWDWGLEQTNIKTHAVRDSCQLPIFTALDLRERLGGREIAKLTIETYQSAWEGAVKDPELWAPRTRETADHSMLFSVACGLIDGKVTPESFEDGRFADPDIIALIKKSGVEVLDSFTEATPEVRNCRITAEIPGGEVVTAHRAVTLKEIKRGMPADQLYAKFRETSRRTYEPARQDAIIAATDVLDSMASVRELLRLLDL